MTKYAILLAAAFPAALAAQVRDTVSDTVTLPPVTVTATRRTESLFSVPLAVTRITRDAWQGSRALGLDDALALVPGVLAQSRYGSGDVRLVIRGFGARGAGDRSNAGTSRGVRVLLDGFPETEPDGRTSFDGIDLASAHGIEVLRSNASSVWGNAAGGVVSISTVPDFEHSLLSAETATGGFGLRRLAVTLGGTAGGTASPSRLAATVSHATFDGWRVHSDSRRTLINASLLAPLGERTRLGVYALGTDNLFRIPGPLTAAQVAADPRQANLTYAQRDERRHNRLGRLGVRLDHDLGVATTAGVALFVNPKYLQRSERGTFRDFTRYHVGGNATLETRALGGTLVTGIDAAYQDGAILFYSLTPAGTRGDTLRDDKREGALNLGGFAQQELTFGTHWVVVLGARYDVISYYSQNFLAPALDADKSFRGVTPKVGVTWRRTTTHSVYASVGGGVEAPAGNETDPASTFGQDTVTAINPLLEPIRSTTWEVGTRQLVTWPHGVLRALSYDVALYDTRVTNEIVPYRGGRFYFTAAGARRRGAELGLTLHAAGGASLQAAVAVQHHRYSDYIVDSVHYGVPGAVADYSGNEVVGVPGLTYAASFVWAPAPLAPLQLRFGVQGASSYFTDDANQVEVPAYRVASLTAATARPLSLGPGLGLHAFVTVNNLFDRSYIASAFLNPDVVAGVPVAFEPGLPRNLVVGISLVRRPAP
ncbi:MAG TPA: TonB-dependent receptor [Gemmatimonadales bacterium]|nr:TonB-dependent receptor [Gemmatimonadales bacterium]